MIYIYVVISRYNRLIISTINWYKNDFYDKTTIRTVLTRRLQWTYYRICIIITNFLIPIKIIMKQLPHYATPSFAPSYCYSIIRSTNNNDDTTIQTAISSYSCCLTTLTLRSINYHSLAALRAYSSIYSIYIYNIYILYIIHPYLTHTQSHFVRRNYHHHIVHLRSERRLHSPTTIHDVACCHLWWQCCSVVECCFGVVATRVVVIVRWK